MANLTKRINIQNTNEENQIQDFSEYFPQLIWVLRDFSLDKGDITPK